MAPGSAPAGPIDPRYSRIDLGDITQHNIKLLKKVNAVVFPVVYHAKFYTDVLEAGELAKLAFYNDIVVGAVCCRIDIEPATGLRKLYIMTLGCLAPYRRLGIGTAMLKHVMDYVERDGQFDGVFLHVQINNESAIQFYRKFGFDIVGTKEQYYSRIEPADAHVLEKRLTSQATTGGTPHPPPLVNGNNPKDDPDSHKTNNGHEREH
jgi:Acetyltransferases